MDNYKRVPVIQILHNLHDVNLYPHEYITIWANKFPLGEEREAEQIEIRIREDGKTQIFCSLGGSKLEFIDWSEWTE